MRKILLLGLAPLLLANTNADTGDNQHAIPPAIRAMLEAAMKSGKEGEVATIVKYAKVADPDSAKEVAKIAEDWNADRRKKATQRLQQADFFTLVDGRAELGGFLTTGNTHNVGITATIDLKREGFWWRHKLKLMADYQESNGIKTREHYLAAFEPNYKINDRAYIYGAAQYESDHFLGYDNRYSLSAGAGYSAIKQRNMTLDLELGPAFRHTDFADDTVESNLAARGSMAFKWKVSDAITLRQDASAYLQSANSTVSSNTALSARLFGPVSGQVSYQVQYESIPAVGRVDTDTTSRASLVYSF